MKVEECILTLLVEHNGGRTAEQLADEINRRKLHIRKDGQPVSVKQIWHAVKTHPETFTFEIGREGIETGESLVTGRACRPDIG